MNETSEAAGDEGTEELTGVVLAGGFSRRFGDRDKALVRLGGRPLLGQVVDRLASVADGVVVNCRTDQREAFEAALDPASTTVRFVTDPVPDRGPLFGFRTALRRVETDYCALAACDAPFLDPRLLADLVRRVDAPGATFDADAPCAPDAAAVRTGERCHPTQAVYRTAPTVAACEALLDADDRRLAALFDRLDHLAVPADEVTGDAERSLFDVDTPEDRDRAAEMLADRPPEDRRSEDRRPADRGEVPAQR